MGLKSISVEGLFGNLNHEITLNEEGITLIHGPNGCGKTTVLKLLMSLKKHDMRHVESVNFRKLILRDKQDSTLTVEKGPFVKTKRSAGAVLKVSYRDSSTGQVQHKYFKENDIHDVQREKIQHFIKNNLKDGGNIDTIKKFESMMFYNSYVHRVNRIKKPHWFSDFLQKLNLEFIETQRLFKISKHDDSDDEITNVINIHSDEFKKIINDKFNESAEVSQKSERTFPHRLLTLSENQRNTELEVREKYEQTQSKIKRLMSLGLIEFEDIIPLPERDLDSTELKVISLNLQDISSKLQVYDDTIEKVELFIKIISSKLRNKEFCINRKDGFVFKTYESETSKANGKYKTIDPSLLSSGEQHQIVLFYKLIFNSDESSLFLIDEPEISLHVDWQRKFLSDVLTIASISNKSFLIATHSPQIIGSNRHLSVSLDGGILYD